MSNNFKIERKNDVLARIPFSKATLHRRINDGTFPPAISLGANSVGFLSHEIDSIITAMAIGENLKTVVSNLVERRKSLFEETYFTAIAA